MPYWLNIALWMIGVVVALVVVGGFEFALEKWFFEG